MGFKAMELREFPVAVILLKQNRMKNLNEILQLFDMYEITHRRTDTDDVIQAHLFSH